METEHSHLYSEQEPNNEVMLSQEDYSEYGLENDWFKNESTVEEVIDSIKNKELTANKVAELYMQFHHHVDRENPEESQADDFEKISLSKQMNKVANEIFIAAKDAYPNIKLDDLGSEKESDIINHEDSVN